MADTSAMFELLADGTRRRLLIKLCDQASVEVSDEVLTRGGAGTSSVRSGRQSSAGREPTDARAVELRHHHLPKLDSHGVIEWDRETRTVSRGPEFEAIRPFLELLSTNSHSLPIGVIS
jgi:hypothetical protein